MDGAEGPVESGRIGSVVKGGEDRGGHDAVGRGLRTLWELIGTLWRNVSENYCCERRIHTWQTTRSKTMRE